MSVDNYENRRRIEQVVKNELPGCSVVFVDAAPGCLEFRIRAQCGAFRSGIISLLAHHRNVRINSAWLNRQLRLNPPSDTLGYH